MASLFIVFEGPNGVGETVLIEAVGAAIEERLIPVLRTKEPTVVVWESLLGTLKKFKQ